MGHSPVKFWTSDVPLNTYNFALFHIGLPFALFGNYVIYQLQVVGYTIGAEADEAPCMKYLTSRPSYEIWYGAVAIPVYWPRDSTLRAFNVLVVPYVVYAMVSYILSVVFCMFIPYCMRTAGSTAVVEPIHHELSFVNTKKLPSIEASPVVEESEAAEAETKRKHGFAMSTWGGIRTFASGVLALMTVIILSQTLPVKQVQSTGLLVTTITGFITIIGSVVLYIGLPQIPAKPKASWKSWWISLFTPLKEFLLWKNMIVLLFSYTMYVDTVFALNSNTAQLYFLEGVPDTLEFSLYSLAFNLFGAFTTLCFVLWQIWRLLFRLA